MILSIFIISNPKDDNPKQIKDPAQILSEQGLLLFSHSQPYFVSPYGKIHLDLVENKELTRRELQIRVLV